MLATGGSGCGTGAPPESLQRPAAGLLALDRLEERLEIPLAEAARAVPLDYLEEQRRPVGHRLGEDLEHVPLVVAINEDAQLGQFLDILVNRADAVRKYLVVGLRHAQERHVVMPHGPHGLDDV